MARRFALSLAALIVAASAAASSAATLDFMFSFTNKRNNPDGTQNSAADGTAVVTGIVRGLKDNATSKAASVEVLGNTDGFGVGEYIGGEIFNTWTVVNGQLTDLFFLSEGEDNKSGSGVTTATLRFDFEPPNSVVAGLTNHPFISYSGTTDLVFTLVPPTTPVPLPAPALLLAAGLGAVAFIGRRRAAA